MNGRDRIWSRPKNILLRTKGGDDAEASSPLSPNSDGAYETFSLMNSFPIKETDQRKAEAVDMKMYRNDG